MRILTSARDDMSEPSVDAICRFVVVAAVAVAAAVADARRFAATDCVQQRKQTRPPCQLGITYIQSHAYMLERHTFENNCTSTDKSSDEAVFVLRKEIRTVKLY